MEHYGTYSLSEQDMDVFNDLLANNVRASALASFKPLDDAKLSSKQTNQCVVQEATYDEELISAGFNSVVYDSNWIDWDKYMNIPSGLCMATWQDSTTEGMSAPSEQIYAQLAAENGRDDVGYTPQEPRAENAHETFSHPSANLATISDSFIPNRVPRDTPSVRAC